MVVLSGSIVAMAINDSAVTASAAHATVHARRSDCASRYRRDASQSTAASACPRPCVWSGVKGRGSGMTILAPGRRC
ncbi:Uncharacterised protein [Bordetella pertussis]|nr:Uncharacterised protein [Bordetella pertussis]